MVLSNIAFNNQYAALRLLEAGADIAACDLIQDSDKTRHSDVMEAVRRKEWHKGPMSYSSTVEAAISYM